MPLDFNAGEIVILVVLAVIIFGPEKLPDLARKAGRVVNYLRNIANDAKGQLQQELGTDLSDLDLSDLNPRTLVQKHVFGPVSEATRPVRDELETATQLARGAGAEASLSTDQDAPNLADGQPGGNASSALPRFDTEAT